MSEIATANGIVKTTNRYRLPGIKREGIAQLSLLETALWPLKGGQLAGSMFDTSYSFQSKNERHKATVSVYAPLGMQSIDEYVLWGLLGLSLSQAERDPALLATPYWLIKNLGLSMGGFQYDQLRASLERLAVVAYQNTGFYNPVSQEHERVTFHFFSCYLPTRGRGATVDNERAWRIEWSPTFFQMCQATGGTLLFDLDLYHSLSPAARRLFLKLKDRFWRSKHIFLNVNDLTVNGLGFSASRPLKKRKYDLIHCIEELLEHKVIELGRGHSEAHDLFIRRGKGLYIVQFFPGEYFRKPLAERTITQKKAIADDPLYQPLRTIGVDDAGIRRLFTVFSRGVIQRWIRIADVAMHEKPRGFPGFKTSPAAFLIDGIQNNRLPPDWIYAHEKESARRTWEVEHPPASDDETAFRRQYQQERDEAMHRYVASTEGREKYQSFHKQFLEFYRAVEPDRFQQAAHAATLGKIERECFQFPDYGVWVLEQHRN